MLILASNYKSDLDETFLRRFNSLIHFPMPGASDRLLLWKKSLPSGLRLADDIDVGELAKNFEMTGAGILNAVQFASLQAHGRTDDAIKRADLIGGCAKSS